MCGESDRDGHDACGAEYGGEIDLKVDQYRAKHQNYTDVQNRLLND